MKKVPRVRCSICEQPTFLVPASYVDHLARSSLFCYFIGQLVVNGYTRSWRTHAFQTSRWGQELHSPIVHWVQRECMYLQIVSHDIIWKGVHVQSNDQQVGGSTGELKECAGSQGVPKLLVRRDIGASMHVHN
jgi:hypothetical protein